MKTHVRRTINSVAAVADRQMKILLKDDKKVISVLFSEIGAHGKVYPQSKEGPTA
jgi:hypothetical protein